MELYSSDEVYKLYHGNMLDMLDVIEPNSIDAIVTDPPYELGFMGKSWDSSGIAFQKETWEKCLHVLKPGGHLLAFGGSRTHHRIACAIEDAGFEIRDCIMYLFGSGFPKSMNIGKAVESKLVNGSANKKDFQRLDGTKVESGNWGITKMTFEQGARPADYSADGHLRTVEVNYTTKEGKRWDGWGTQLKPSYEPIIVARKPCDGSIVDNVLKWECGCINIDDCRIPFKNEEDYAETANKNQHEKFGTKPLTNNVVYGDYSMVEPKNYKSIGRFPANTILTYDETDYEEVCGGFPNGGVNGTVGKVYKDTSNIYGDYGNKLPFQSYGDSGSASRYFYCAKASKRDRDEGLSSFIFQRGETLRKNIHPTVKPVALMQYLIRLVTPEHGTVLDPFNGSGSTGKAVVWENRDRNSYYKYIGIELTEEYLPIAKARIEYAEHAEYIAIEEQKKEFKKEKPGQALSMFDADDIF